MCKKSEPSATAAAASTSSGRRNELGWRVHDNAQGWVAQVDIKASATLAIEAVILGLAVALVSDPDSLQRMTIAARWVIGGGILALLASVVLSVLVLLPSTKSRESTTESRGYLTNTLTKNDVEDIGLASQIIEMSKIAWRKHVRLRWSLYFLITGIVIIGVVYILLTVGLFPDYIGDLTAPAAPKDQE